MNGIDSLKKSPEFDRVFSEHLSSADRNMVVYAAQGTGKIGIIASKKFGNSVERHRFRRVIREIYRKNKEKISAETDIIIIARFKAKESEFTELEKSFLTLLKRSSDMKEKKN